MQLETSAAPGQGAHVRPEPPPSQGRQERWLFELEQALLAQQGQKDAARELPAEPRRPAVVAAADVPVAGSAPLPAAGMAAAPPDGRGASNAGPHAADDDGGNLAPSSVQPSSLVPDAYARYALPDAGLPAGSTSVAMAAPAAALARASTTGSGAAQLVLPDALSRPAVALPPMPAAAALATLPNAAHAEVAADAVPTARPAPGEAQDFAARQMHLYRGSDGVHAWIRDAALSEGQGRLVAQAVALELRGAGGRLKAMTVNGKVLQLAGYGSDAVDGFVDGQTWDVQDGAAGRSITKKDAI